MRVAVYFATANLTVFKDISNDINKEYEFK